jgi:cytochrome P450
MGTRAPVGAPNHAGSPPGAWPVFGHFPAYGRDPLGFVTRVATNYGGVVPLRLGPYPALLITDPAAIEEVLVTRHRDFRKSRAARRVGVVIGNGLLLSEGPVWREHRRAVQPAFHRERIDAWGDLMVQQTALMLGGWADGQTRDVHADMSALMLEIVVRTLLGSDIGAEDVIDVRAAAATLTEHFESRFNSIRFFVPDALPTPGNRRMRAAVKRLDAIIYGLIVARRSSGERANDAISMLLEASEMPATPLTDRELRDEVMTLFLAGHETTALALTWALHLIAEAPRAQDALEAELDGVLAERQPQTADLPRLRYCEATIFEALRLYPPAYAISREAVRRTTIGGREVREGTVAFISVWAAHRDPARFEEPEAFRPERWLDGLARRLPRGAYLPFAEGPRKCIGAAFAMQEAVLVLATIASRFRLSAIAGPPIVLRPAVTLRPSGPVPVSARTRGRGQTPATM